MILTFYRVLARVTPVSDLVHKLGITLYIGVGSFRDVSSCAGGDGSGVLGQDK